MAFRRNAGLRIDLILASRKMAEKCAESRIDYVALDTSMPYDKAIMEYLLSRRGRF